MSFDLIPQKTTQHKGNTGRSFSASRPDCVHLNRSTGPLDQTGHNSELSVSVDPSYWHLDAFNGNMGMSAATAVRHSDPSYNSSNVDVRMRNHSSSAVHCVKGFGKEPVGLPSVTPINMSPPSSPGQSPGRPSRCCFCCLAVKSGNGGSDKNRDNKLSSVTEKDEPPTLEELRMWGESFEKLMKCSGGRKLFGEFLRSEYSEENMMFYLACEDLKKERVPELIEEKARLIYEDYISILSPKEVSLDSRVREVINRNMVEPTPQTFDEAQLQIWTLMHRDSYPRFLNSQLYKKLLQRLS